MTTTTVTFTYQVGDAASTLAFGGVDDYVVAALGDYAGDYAVDSLTAAYTEALNTALPSGLHLYRNGEVIADADWSGDARNALNAALDAVDLYQLAQRYES